eukprot:jgi/Botrbrau1/21113/Bobra.0061s0008.1
MRITREEAYRILEVDEGSDMSTIKQAYRKQALIWHPDKNKDKEAKEMFQKISASYTRLTRDEESSEEEFEWEEEDAMDFFEFMFHVRMATRGYAPAQGFRVRVPTDSSSYYGFPFSETTDSRFNRSSREPDYRQEAEWRRSRRAEREEAARRRAERQQQQAEKNREDMQEKRRVRREAKAEAQKEREAKDEQEVLEEARRAAIAFAERQLARPTMVSRTDTSITISLSRSFPEGNQLPEGVVLELSARPGNSGTWQGVRCVAVTNTLGDLLPGTKYIIRARSGYVSNPEVETWGPWSAESNYSTTGSAAPVAQVSVGSAPGQGKKARRKAASAKKAGQESGKQQQAKVQPVMEVEDEEEGESDYENAMAELIKEERRKAVLEQLASQYEKSTAEIMEGVKKASEAVSQKVTAASTAAKKKKVKRKPGGARPDEEQELNPLPHLDVDPFGGVVPASGPPRDRGPPTGPSPPVGPRRSWEDNVTINARQGSSSSRPGPQPQPARFAAPPAASSADAFDAMALEEAMQLSLALEASRQEYEREQRIRELYEEQEAMKQKDAEKLVQQSNWEDTDSAHPNSETYDAKQSFNSNKGHQGSGYYSPAESYRRETKPVDQYRTDGSEQATYRRAGSGGSNSSYPSYQPINGYPRAPLPRPLMRCFQPRTRAGGRTCRRSTLQHTKEAAGSNHKSKESPRDRTIRAGPHTARHISCGSTRRIRAIRAGHLRHVTEPACMAVHELPLLLQTPARIPSLACSSRGRKKQLESRRSLEDGAPVSNRQPLGLRGRVIPCRAPAATGLRIARSRLTTAGNLNGQPVSRSISKLRASAISPGPLGGTRHQRTPHMGGTTPQKRPTRLE